MSYLGDYQEDYTKVNFTFASTVGGVMTALAGSPAISVYKGNSTTQSVAGITLTEGFDSNTGQNQVLIDLSADAFYAIGEDYTVYLSAGTLGGNSVIGRPVAYFSIENRRTEDVITAVGQIGTSGGAALNFAAADDNVDGALNGVTFVGTQTSGTFVSTEAEDGTNHVIDDDTNNIDIVYQFAIGGGRTATEVIWKGFLNTNNASMNIQMYDFVGMDWETRATISGKNQSANETVDFPVLSKHTGTGANIGIVYVRFITAGGSNQTLETDELIVEAVNIGQSTGYANGQIWFDSNNGTEGTESFVNGTADNPAKTWADVLTLSSQTGLTDFHIINASTVQLSASSANFSLFGDNWTLDLNGQNISNAHFEGAVTSGTGTNTTGEATFSRCEIGNVTIPTGTHFIDCEMEGTVTFGEAGIFFFEECKHGSSSGPAIIDFGSGLNSSTVHMHPYNGAVEIQNMGANTGTYLLHINGSGAITFNANCSATSTINLSGDWLVTNNAAGLTINVDDNSLVSTRLGRSVGVIQEFTIDNTSFTATSTQAQVDAVDIDSLEATDDHYNSRIIIFTSGALKHQATDITDYDGTSKRFTYTNLTEAPSDNDTFIVI